MCLDRTTFRKGRHHWRKPKAKAIRYKVVFQVCGTRTFTSCFGFLRGWCEWVLGKEYICKKSSLHSNEMFDDETRGVYKSGFHVFISKEAAREYLETCLGYYSESYKIVKVECRGLVARGLQEGFDCSVYQWMKIVEVL